MPHLPNLLLPFILIIFGTIGLIRSRAARQDKKKRDDFFAKESEANSVKKRDLSTLSYITVDETLCNVKSDDSEISELLSTLNNLKDKKILNLTGISNTDLKLKYGTANIAELSEYDDNFAALCKTLNSLGTAFYKAGDIATSKRFLEYAVGIRTDITDSYVTLATIYNDCN